MTNRIYALSLLVALAACGTTNSGDGGSTGGTGGNPNLNSGPTVGFDAGYAHYIGRVVPNSDGGVLLAWPGSGVETRVTGATYINVTVAPRQHGAYNYVGVLVDSKFVESIKLQNLYGTYTYRITIPSTDDHTITVLKRTEAGNGDVLVSTLVTDGQFEKLGNPGRTIEVIGENATAGFSADGPAGQFTGAACQTTSWDSPDYIANPNFENAADTYGVQAAQMFGADWSLVAYTGRGLIQNFDGSNTDTLPTLWPRLDPRDYNTVSAPQQTPDVVVLNLGANDINYWLYNPNMGAPNQAGFVAGYAAFLQQINSAYPNAKIIATIGPTLSDFQKLSNGQGLLTFATQAVQSAISQAKSAGVNATYLAFTPDTTNASCDYFPDTVGHTNMAKALATAISQVTGWTSGSTGNAQPAPAGKGQGPQNITQTFSPLPDPLANAGDPNSTGIATQEFPQCNVCAPSLSAQNVNGCAQTVGVNEACQGYCHVPNSFNEPYGNNPPTSGNHYPNPWATLGESLTPVPRGRLLHSMEHGAVVIAYNCPQGCDADLATVRQVVKSNVMGDPNNAQAPGNTWVILTPDPLLTGSNFAALSWTWSYAFNTANAATLQCFINQHVYYGRECTAKTTTQRTDYASAGCSPLLDENMSSVTQ